MPAKWQRWMPFEIDAFRGSPSVQAMHPAARSGYLYLLADAWQTDDCTIGTDPIELADRSGLGDELWTVHGPRILRKFEPVEGTDRLRNAPLFERWLEAKRVHDARKEAAHRINSHRSPSPNAAVTERSPSRSVDTHTHTITETYTEKEIPKSKNPSSRSRSKGAKKSDPRHSVFREILSGYWKSKNPVEMPWDASEAKALSEVLAASPDLTAETFRQMLGNRWKSDVNHSERPRLWLRNVMNYASGPVDRYGKPLSTNGGNRNGNGTYKSKSDRVLEAGREALASIAARYGVNSDGSEPGSGPEREDAGVIRGEVVRPA